MRDGVPESTEVIIVGGGLVGLSAAAFLAWHGVACTLVERRADLSVHPRARGVNPRAVEAFRQIGLEPALREAGRGFAEHTVRARVESLTGRELFRADLPAPGDLDEITPSAWALCGQDRLEPLLRRHAEDLGARLLFGWEMAGFEEDAEGVIVSSRRRQEDRTHLLRGRYLIGADGARSSVRRRVGIELKGTETLQRQLSIVFAADLREALGDRRFAICQVRNPAVDGLLVHDDTLRQGTLYVHESPEGNGQDLTDLSPARCVELVRAAVGIPELPVTILDTQQWDLSACCATAYRRGRVFLMGDAVHVMPPVGGFGASTGIQDAHNLAWKLAFVLGGQADPALLDSYEPERMPLAESTLDQCVRRMETRTGFGRPSAASGVVDDLTLILGYRYETGAVIHPEPPRSALIDPHELAGEPGTRAPHVALRPWGRSRASSTLDLFGRTFTLLTGPGGASWRVAAERVGGGAGTGLVFHQMTDEIVVDGAAAWCRRYGVDDDGAVLVRPDGFVAWRRRSAAECPDDELRAALQRLLGAPW